MEVVSTPHEFVACAKALPRNFANLERYAEELKMMELQNMTLEKELAKKFKSLAEEAMDSRFASVDRVVALMEWAYNHGVGVGLAKRVKEKRAGDSEDGSRQPQGEGS